MCVYLYLYICVFTPYLFLSTSLFYCLYNSFRSHPNLGLQERKLPMNIPDRSRHTFTHCDSRDQDGLLAGWMELELPHNNISLAFQFGIWSLLVSMTLELSAIASFPIKQIDGSSQQQGLPRTTTCSWTFCG